MPQSNGVVYQVKLVLEISGHDRVSGEPATLPLYEQVIGGTDQQDAGMVMLQMASRGTLVDTEDVRQRIAAEIDRIYGNEKEVGKVNNG
jgi:hypothetical protein